MKVLRVIPILIAAILVGLAMLTRGEDGSPLERLPSPYPRVAPTLSIPPERPPEATLSAQIEHPESTTPAQVGTLIGHVWLDGGTPTEMNPPDSVEWPPSLPLHSRAATMTINSASAPVHVLLRFRQEPRAGLTLDATEQDCWQKGWTADGAIPECVFEQRPDGQSTVLDFDLPPAPGTWYLTVEAIWLAPVDSKLDEPPLLPIWRTWWAFSVDVDEVGFGKAANQFVVARRA